MLLKQKSTWALRLEETRSFVLHRRDSIILQSLGKFRTVYISTSMFLTTDSGGANSFTLHWPCVRGRQVWQGDGYRDDATLWLDQTKPPFKPGITSLTAGFRWAYRCPTDERA